MFLSLVTGILYFTFAVTGLALSTSLAILIIGLAFFLAFIGITRVISLAEGRLLEAVSGERMPRRPLHRGAPDGLMARILETPRDQRTWTTLLYLVMMLPLGLYFVIAVTGLSLGVSFLTVPVVGVSQRFGWWLPWDREDVGVIQFTPEWLDTPGSWVFDVVFGVVVLTTLLHVARAALRIHARTAKTLLVLRGG